MNGTNIYTSAPMREQGEPIYTAMLHEYHAALCKVSERLCTLNAQSHAPQGDARTLEHRIRLLRLERCELMDVIHALEGYAKIERGRC